MTNPESTHTPRSPRLRKVGLVVALWVFGLSTTVLLVGIWGRTVTSDQTAIEASAQAVLESDAVADRITGWIAGGVESAAGELPEGVAAVTANAVWHRSETRAVLAGAVDRLVAAALAPPGESVPIDLADLLRLLIPIVMSELSDIGVNVTKNTMESALAELPAINVGSEADVDVAGVVADARSTFTRVVAVAMIAMLASGIAAVAFAEQRLQQIRSLAIRVVVSAVTFSVLLRVGSWALDPGGGRSPLAEGGSVILSSSGHVLVIAALVAGGVAFFAAVGVQRRRRTLAA